MHPKDIKQEQWIDCGPHGGLLCFSFFKSSSIFLDELVLSLWEADVLHVTGKLQKCTVGSWQFYIVIMAARFKSQPLQKQTLHWFESSFGVSLLKADKVWNHCHMLPAAECDASLMKCVWMETWWPRVGIDGSSLSCPGGKEDLCLCLLVLRLLVLAAVGPQSR